MKWITAYNKADRLTQDTMLVLVMNNSAEFPYVDLTYGKLQGLFEAGKLARGMVEHEVKRLMQGVELAEVRK